MRRICLCDLQKSSASAPAAEYKKTDEPQPDVKEEAEEEEAKDEEPGLTNKPLYCCYLH